MLWATCNSFSMAAFEAVVLFSSSTYFTSECCMSSNELRSKHISSLCFTVGNGVLKLPFATSSAEAASCLRGLVMRRIVKWHTKNTTSNPMAIRNSNRPPTIAPMRLMPRAGTDSPSDQSVYLMGA